MKHVSLPHKSIGRIYALPTLIALVVALGLTSALLGDEIWDTLSWITLLIPVAVFLFGWGKRAK